MKGRNRNILYTLLYFDIFKYPLTKEEIWQFLPEKTSKTQFIKEKINDPRISFSDGYYFIKGREKNVNLRKNREIASNLKLIKAVSIARRLKIIPFVEFIGISGALAMKNCNEDDDIDLFIICKNNLAWTTRLLLISMLVALNVYRRSNDEKYKDKICLNFLLGNKNLSFRKTQNLYLAHEISQMVPVYSKSKAYKEFIRVNNWIFSLLPNINNRIENYNIKFERKETLAEKMFTAIINFIQIEKITRIIQFWYMKNKITKEVVDKNFIAFHPLDYKNRTLLMFERKKKIF